MAISESTRVVDVEPRIGQTRFADILAQHASPAAAEAATGWQAVVDAGVDPLFALAVFARESQFGRSGITASLGLNNPGHTRRTRTGIGEIVETDLGRFVRYPTWTDGWRDLAFRLVDPSFVYVQENRRTIRPIVERWAPASDGNDPAAYVAAVVETMNGWANTTPAGVEPNELNRSTPLPLVFGRVPHPPFVDRLIPDANSRCYDDLGQRRPVGTCVHKMDGSLWNVDGYFRKIPSGGFDFCPEDRDDPEFFVFGGCRALTDYGIGGALDGADDGTILRWNDPRGEPRPEVSANRSPWANGRTNGVEGNGQPFIDAYTREGVNRNLVSIELSGWSNTWGGHTETDVTEKQFDSLCRLIAYWHDQARVPWNDFPINPEHGIVTQLQHYEFTGDKDCPWPIIKNLRPRYVKRVQEIMKRHQTLRVVKPTAPPPFDGTDKQIGDAIFRADKRVVEVAVDELFLRKAASPTADLTRRRPLARGDHFQALYWVEGREVEGERRWWITARGARVWTGGTVEKPDAA